MKIRTIRKLTDRAVAGYAPASREYSIFDANVRRLALRVQPNGARSWIVRGTVRGRSLRLTLGPADRLRVDQARAAAREALTTGLQPQRPETKTPTFKDFTSLHFKRKAPGWSPEGRRTFLSRLNLVLLPAFSSIRIGLITHADVANWFYSYSRKRPGNANQALAYLKAILNCAKKWGFLPETHANPCQGIYLNRLPPRGRLVNAEGLERLGVVLERRRSDVPGAVDAIELLLLTGCRRGEILTLRWVHLRNNRLVLPRSKTGPKVVPLGEPALTCLRRLRKLTKSVFVFPSQFRKGKPMGEIGGTWRSIRKEAQLDEDVRIHDLRHSYASHSLFSGETLHITGALLGHKRMESTARYAHLVDEHLLAAAERIAQRIVNWMDQ